MSLEERVVSSVAVSTCFVVTAFVFAPSQIFLTNVREFDASYFELLGYLFVIALPFFSLAVVFTAFFPRNLAARQKIAAVLLSLSLLIWLQGHILVCDYGLLTGGKIYFNTYYLMLDGAIWLLVIIIVCKKSASFYEHARFISCAFSKYSMKTNLTRIFLMGLPITAIHSVVSQQLMPLYQIS